MASSFTLASQAGLTPQIPIVNGNGTPTTFFFRWLWQLRSAALSGATATDDVGVLESFSLGEIPAGLSEAVAAAIGSPRPEIRDVLANIPAGFNLSDAGQLFTATDYQHRYRWTGSAWQFLEGDASGYMVMSKPDGTAPNGGLWGLCDGTAYDVAQPDGTIVSVTTLNLAVPGQFLSGDASGALIAATAPTWAAGAATDAENAHTHAVDPPPTSTSNDGTGTEVQSGAGTTVASNPHHHSVDILPFTSGAGTAHSHQLSNATAQLNPPSDASGGLPARIGVRFYIRR